MSEEKKFRVLVAVRVAQGAQHGRDGTAEDALRPYAIESDRH